MQVKKTIQTKKATSKKKITVLISPASNNGNNNAKSTRYSSTTTDNYTSVLSPKKNTISNISYRHPITTQSENIQTSLKVQKVNVNPQSQKSKIQKNLNQNGGKNVIENSQQMPKNNIKNKNTEKKNLVDLNGLSELDKDILSTYDINKKDELIFDLTEKIPLQSEFTFYDKNDINLPPLERQEKLINKLLRTRNFQNFITRTLNNEPITFDKEGKDIIFTLFNKDLYDLEFLDIYYKHEIPYIIMRPRLDVIKRKREQKILEEKKNIENEEIKNIENEEIKNTEIGIENYIEDQKLSKMLDESIQSEIEKGGIIVGEDKDHIKIEKRESLFPNENTTFQLTKIPQKTEENTQNRRLNIAFNKAKDAARVVRRLEYSYSMRVNILLSKPIFQKNAKVIQNWWKSVLFIKRNSKKIIKLQAYARGAMIRKAFKECKKRYEYIFPFLKEIDMIISRRKLKIYLDRIVKKYAIKKLIRLAIDKMIMVRNALNRFKNRLDFLKQTQLLSIPHKNKCAYTKDIFDWEIKLKLYKIQSKIKFYLMHNNERIIRDQYANVYNPKLYYMLKYGHDQNVLKNKLNNFRKTILKLKEWKYKSTLPGDVSNKFLYFKYILKKIFFGQFLSYYNDSLNNKDPKYQQRMKTKILLNRLRIKNNKDILKKYLTKWNIQANYLKEYYKILKLDKLYILEAIFRYQKKYRERVFLFLLQNIHTTKQNQKIEATKNIFELFNRTNGTTHDHNILVRALEKWRKNAINKKLNETASLINCKVKNFLFRKKIKRKKLLIKLVKIRNKKFDEKLKLWKFNSKKINHHFNYFTKKTKNIILTKKRLGALKKNFNLKLQKEKVVLKKYFDKFKTNTGVRRLVLINVQLTFFDENKEIISADKYSTMKYVRNMKYVDVDKLKKDLVLKQNFDFWKISKKACELKRLCGKRIQNLCDRSFYLEKLKFLHWHKMVIQQKYDRASRIIQREYLYYKKRAKNKDNKINDVKEIDDKTVEIKTDV